MSRCDFSTSTIQAKFIRKTQPVLWSSADFRLRKARGTALFDQITGAKANFFASRGNPNDWEIKSLDFLTPNNWKRAIKRRFCFEIAKVLQRNDCHVHVVSMEKALAVGALDEAKFVPLGFQRLVAKFNDEVISHGDTGSIVCDWSTYQMDRHVTNCVSSMVIAKEMWRLRGGITYGSSRATPPLQVADLIAGTVRRSLEGFSHLDDLADVFRQLHFVNPGRVDVLGFPVDSVFCLF